MSDEGSQSGADSLRGLTGVTVRFAQVSDADAISALVCALTPLFFDDPCSELPTPVQLSLSPEGCRTRLAESNYQSWVATHDGELIGYGAVRDRRHLYHLFVSQSHQRRGVATALWQRMLPHCDPGPVTVWSSLVAVAVYRRFGFVEEGEVSCKMGLTYQPMVLQRGVALEDLT